MPIAFPEPTADIDDPRDVLLGYLDYFRSVVAGHIAGLGDGSVHSTMVPSGWTPIELVNHLVAMERRWFVWGFEGEQVDDPWSDSRDGRWSVADTMTVADVISALYRGGDRTRAIITSHALDDIGVDGPRWDGAPAPRLERVLLHVIQEYARHAGHLDIVRELTDGVVGPA